MTKIEQIDNRIAELKRDLKEVEGTPTEVYARIVGYYRPVSNWNKGKSEEFGLRKVFTKAEEKTKNMFSDEPSKAEGAAEKENPIVNYLYFFRQTCPNCPSVANALQELAISGSAIDVDTEEGLSLAREHNVLAAPTVIFIHTDGKEAFRTSSAESVRSVPSAKALKVPV